MIYLRLENSCFSFPVCSGLICQSWSEDRQLKLTEFGWAIGALSGISRFRRTHQRAEDSEYVQSSHAIRLIRTRTLIERTRVGVRTLPERSRKECVCGSKRGDGREMCRKGAVSEVGGSDLGGDDGGLRVSEEGRGSAGGKR